MTKPQDSTQKSTKVSENYNDKLNTIRQRRVSPRTAVLLLTVVGWLLVAVVTVENIRVANLVLAVLW